MRNFGVILIYLPKAEFWYIDYREVVLWTQRKSVAITPSPLPKNNLSKEHVEYRINS